MTQVTSYKQLLCINIDLGNLSQLRTHLWTDCQHRSDVLYDTLCIHTHNYLHIGTLITANRTVVKFGSHIRNHQYLVQFWKSMIYELGYVMRM